jgi:molecular chaperone GrpE
MSEDKDNRLDNDGAESSAHPQDDQASAADRQIAKLEEELRKKAEEVTASRDQHLRAVADADNLRKRMQKEKSEGIRYANESLLRELLQVIDSLELAVEHADLGGNGKSVVEGVQLTLRLFRDILERQGVKPIADPTGKSFDPTTQEASLAEAQPGVPANTVLRAQSKGYRYNDRLLRPARVVVASKDQNAGEDEPVE